MDIYGHISYIYLYMFNYIYIYFYMKNFLLGSFENLIFSSVPNISSMFKALDLFYIFRYCSTLHYELNQNYIKGTYLFEIK